MCAPLPEPDEMGKARHEMDSDGMGGLRRAGSFPARSETLLVAPAPAVLLGPETPPPAHPRSPPSPPKRMAPMRLIRRHVSHACSRFRLHSAAPCIKPPATCSAAETTTPIRPTSGRPTVLLLKPWPTSLPSPFVQHRSKSTVSSMQHSEMPKRARCCCCLDSQWLVASPCRR